VCVRVCVCVCVCVWVCKSTPSGTFLKKHTHQLWTVPSLVIYSVFCRSEMTSEAVICRHYDTHTSKGVHGCVVGVFWCECLQVLPSVACSWRELYHRYVIPGEEAGAGSTQRSQLVWSIPLWRLLHSSDAAWQVGTVHVYIITSLEVTSVSVRQQGSILFSSTSVCVSIWQCVCLKLLIREWCNLVRLHVAMNHTVCSKNPDP